MDFIEQLLSLGNYTNILIVVNRLTKQAIFIPIQRSLNVIGLANLFVKHIFSKHRVLSYVISDWGLEFISYFFKSLASILQMHLYFTSGYHPKADGQTERTNQTLEQYI